VSVVVLDASAYVRGFTEANPATTALRERLAGGAVHAPHLIVAEVGSVARRMARSGGALTAHRALALLENLPPMVAQFYAHGPLARLAWSRRDNVSFYDGIYLALACTLGVPLLTADARLARAPGLPCAVELID